MDVGLPDVLCLGIDMRLVIVFQGWVIVLAGMSGRHVLPLGAVPEVVHHVSVLDRVMGVFHGLPPLPCCACGNLLAAPGRAGLAAAAPASLGRGSAGRLLMLGLVPYTDSRNPPGSATWWRMRDWPASARHRMSTSPVTKSSTAAHPPPFPLT